MDYLKTRRRLAEDVDVSWLKMFIFDGVDESSPDSQGKAVLYNVLRANGAIVRRHPMTDGKQRRVDVDIGVHLIWQATLPEVKVIVLSTGDQDLIPAVEMAQQKFGKEVILATFSMSVNDELRRHVKRCVEFEDFAAQVMR
jgi:uncharacterized LabA/DUF88 family protein